MLGNSVWRSGVAVVSGALTAATVQKKGMGGGSENCNGHYSTTPLLAPTARSRVDRQNRFHKASVAEQPWAQSACVRGSALAQAVSLTFPCARSRAGVSTAPVSRVCAEALAAALSLFFGPQVEHDVWTPWTHRSPWTSTRSRAGSGEARASRWAVCCRTHGVGCYEWRLSMGAPARSYGCFLYLQFPPVRCRGLAQVPA